MEQYCMNDQIKQLAEEAGFLLWEDEPWKPEGAIIDWSSNYDSVLETYTELIVRECAELVKDRLNHIPDNQNDWDGHNYGETAAVYGILDEFQEHFDVDCNWKNSKFGVEK